jgi:hypothetical protein
MGLGKQLYVQEPDVKEAYQDLDELYARYIEPMNELVSVMVKHRSFLPGTIEEVQNAMFERRKENATRIPYYFRFEPNKPGVFTLTWLSLNIRSDTPVKTLRIEVRPTVRAWCTVDILFLILCCKFSGFSLHAFLFLPFVVQGLKVQQLPGQEPVTFPGPSDLIVWFKKTQESHTAAHVAAAVAARQKAAGGSRGVGGYGSIPPPPMPPASAGHQMYGGAPPPPPPPVAAGVVRKSRFQ